MTLKSALVPLKFIISDKLDLKGALIMNVAPCIVAYWMKLMAVNWLLIFTAYIIRLRFCVVTKYVLISSQPNLKPRISKIHILKSKRLLLQLQSKQNCLTESFLQQSPPSKPVVLMLLISSHWPSPFQCWILTAS